MAIINDYHTRGSRARRVDGGNRRGLPRLVSAPILLEGTAITRERSPGRDDGLDAVDLTGVSAAPVFDRIAEGRSFRERGFYGSSVPTLLTILEAFAGTGNAL